ncbi:unannotated protein [freshwater metagenome]|uniref:Unannotated protein n=1 Tax=freshwater metagenome TaxID=449393 RepID=A0A6J7A6P2_9ZZZZ|nr:hypothetical protein [Actinomycetota bacterium]MSZ06096.1 hypothetical protein [Actinomycetota bacterium]
MKRALLIAGGTLGGLGAVLAVTPPQLSSTSSLNLAGGGAIGAPASTPAAVSSAAAATPVATKSTKAATTKKATTKASATHSSATKASTTTAATTTASASATATSNNSTATQTQTADPTPASRKKTTPTPDATQTIDPTPTPTKAATKTATATPTQTSKGVTGVFTGPSTFVNYGNVQVQITVKDGRITDAIAVQAPSGRNDRYTNMAVPILKKQTLAAQSDKIQGASGASYTSYGWYISLQGALAKAGL